MRMRTLRRLLPFCASLFCLIQSQALGRIDPTDAAGQREYLTKNSRKKGVETLANGLQIRKLKSGPKDGARPGPTDLCVCHYHGTLSDGTVFDSSVDRGRPATFAPDQVIRGWQVALRRMTPGDKWVLTVPPELGYGARGSGKKIPGGAALVFELELLEFRAKGWRDYLTPQAAALVLMGLMFFFGSGGAGAVQGEVIPLDVAERDARNRRVWFDVAIGDRPAGRIRFVLFRGIAPRTVENFRALC